MDRLKKIIEYGSYLLIFLLPLQSRWIIKGGSLNGGYWEYGTISLYGTDVLIIILFFLAVLRIVTERRQAVDKDTVFNLRMTGQKVLWLLIGFLNLIMLVSIYFASDRSLALFKYLQFLPGLGIFLLLTKIEYKRILMFGSLLSGLALQGGLAVWQFLSQSTFAAKWLGLSLHDAAMPGTSVIEINPIRQLPERWLRAYGGFDHPNILGGVMVIAILISLYLSVYFEKKENQRLKSSVYLKMACFIFIALYFMALFFSFSRAAWLGLGVSALLLLIIYVFKDRFGLKVLLRVLALNAAIVLILGFAYQNLIFVRLAAKDRLEVKSNNERILSLKEGWSLVKERWGRGWGLGNYTLAVRDKNPQYSNWDYQPVHNVFMLVWAELGIIGLSVFIGILSLSVIVNIKSLRVTGGGRYALNLSMIISVILMMQFDHWWWSLHSGTLFFWTMLGLTCRK